jgi:hypothetical protein
MNQPTEQWHDAKYYPSKLCLFGSLRHYLLEGQTSVITGLHKIIK